MIEVEAKFALGDVASLERKLVEWQGLAQPARREIDLYFNAPDRDFGATDEALRLRRIGALNFVTYKGPRRDAATKTRAEIEVALADGDAAATDFVRLLSLLGYRPVAVVTKQRRIYLLERDGFRLEVALDEVEGVGRFVELEIKSGEEQAGLARDVLLRTAAELGLSAGERRSYLELLLLSGSR